MAGLAINKTKIINLDKERHLMNDTLLSNIRTIIEQTYVLPANIDIYKQFLYQGPQTMLALFYGEFGDLAGFAAASIKNQTIDMKQYAIYQSCVLFDSLYHDSSAAAKFGLTHAMKYKLTHPEQILAYVAEAPTPMVYSHYSCIVDIYYPKPTVEVPPHVAMILDNVKQQRELISTGQAFCVRHKKPLKINPAIMKLESEYEAELVEYYKSLNPEYHKGHSLLVYMPLDLTNISLGLRNVINPQIAYSFT